MRKAFISIDEKIYDTEDECMKHENLLKAMRYYFVKANPNRESSAHEYQNSGIWVLDPSSFKKGNTESEAEEHIQDYLRYCSQEKFGPEYIMLEGKNMTPDKGLIKNWIIEDITLEQYIDKIVKDGVESLGTIQKRKIQFKES